ncbi:MAG: helix-turn-helix transcriptional regulator [Afipia felis]|nr:helix-turn-helix transcriptional regulator [Afipia felis]
MVRHAGAAARAFPRAMDMVANANEAATLLKTLAHPGRLALACALAEGEFSVGALEERLGIHQPSLSQQLGILRDAGVVKTRREAKQIFYQLAEAKAAQLIEALHAIYCRKGKRR